MVRAVSAAMRKPTALSAARIAQQIREQSSSQICVPAFTHMVGEEKSSKGLDVRRGTTLEQLLKEPPFHINGSVNLREDFRIRL